MFESQVQAHGQHAGDDKDHNQQLYIRLQYFAHVSCSWY